MSTLSVIFAGTNDSPMVRDFLPGSEEPSWLCLFTNEPHLDADDPVVSPGSLTAIVTSHSTASTPITVTPSH